MWCSGRKVVTGKNQSTRRKNPNVILSIKYPIRYGLASSLALRVDRSTNNRLTHDKSMYIVH
jgi:hypothetical protein